MSMAGAERPRAPRPKRRLGRILMACTIMVGSLGSGAMIGLAFSLSKLPDVSGLRYYQPPETTEIFDAKGRLIAKIHDEENRSVVKLREISPWLQKAVIASEDDRFYQHPGIDIRGVLRGTTADLSRRGHATGGSTLTQQLARNLFLTPERAVSRKLAEAYLSIQIEQRYSKAQILEMYLNQVYWGHNCYGIQAAARNYFGKKTKDLTLAECAQLAFLLRGPERFSPYKDPVLAKKGQRIALSRMIKAGFITEAQAAEAYKVQLKYPGVQTFSYRAPYYTSFLLSQLINRYGSDVVMRGGLRVRATLDLDIQQKAEQLLKQAIATHGKRLHFSQGAIVVLDPRTGYIRAMVGGVDYNTSKFNRIIQAHRQPGSSFKPFVYLTAFTEGISPSTVMNDTKVSYDAGSGKLWTPENFDNEHDGDVTLRKALERSNNVVAVKLLSRVGIEPVIENAHRLGIQSPLGSNLSLALGSSEVTPLELASAYSVFAADGMRCEPQAYSVVEDRAGVVVEKNDPRPLRVFDAEPIRVLNDVLMGVVRYGTGAAANIGRPAAGKTGTTSDHRDAWFVGYTPDLVGLIWVGNDDNSKMVGGTTGGGVCAPLWGKLMSFALSSASPSTFVAPKAFAAPAGTKPTQASKSTGVPEFYVPGGEADPNKKAKITLPDPNSFHGDGDSASASNGGDGEPSQILQDMQ